MHVLRVTGKASGEVELVALIEQVLEKKGEGDQNSGEGRSLRL